MGKFISEIEQLYQSVGSLFRSLDDFPKIKKSLLVSKILIEYELLSPAGRMLIDASGDEIKVYTHEWPAELSPKITLTMSCDTCHLYWMGKTSFMSASFNGDIITKGDLGMLLKLIPLAEPLFKVYANICKTRGYQCKPVQSSRHG